MHTLATPRISCSLWFQILVPTFVNWVGEEEKNARAARKDQSTGPQGFPNTRNSNGQHKLGKMINWENFEVTEQPITMNVTDSEVDSFILDKTVFEIGNYPLHTQCVSRIFYLESDIIESRIFSEWPKYAFRCRTGRTTSWTATLCSSIKFAVLYKLIAPLCTYGLPFIWNHIGM